LEALSPLAAALGMGPEDLRDYEPLPGAQAYSAYMAWLAAYTSEAEIAAAYLVNFPAWGQNCGRVGSALKSRYGLDDEQFAFFDLFATPLDGFEGRALAVISDGLERASRSAWSGARRGYCKVLSCCTGTPSMQLWISPKAGP